MRKGERDRRRTETKENKKGGRKREREEKTKVKGEKYPSKIHHLGEPMPKFETESSVFFKYLDV